MRALLSKTPPSTAPERPVFADPLFGGDAAAAAAPLAYSIAGLAAATSASRSILYEAIAAGALPAKKLGGRTLVLRDAAEAWLARLPDAPPGKSKGAVGRTKSPQEPPR